MTCKQCEYLRTKLADEEQRTKMAGKRAQDFENECDRLRSELDLPPGQDEMVRTGQIGLLCALLQRWCEDNRLPFMSADELLHHVLEADCAPEYEHELNAQVTWLRCYIALWDCSDLTETD